MFQNNKIQNKSNTIQKLQNKPQKLQELLGTSSGTVEIAVALLLHLPEAAARGFTRRRGQNLENGWI
jgi:hypothetical protein